MDQETNVLCLRIKAMGRLDSAESGGQCSGEPFRTTITRGWVGSLGHHAEQLSANDVFPKRQSKDFWTLFTPIVFNRHGIGVTELDDRIERRVTRPLMMRRQKIFHNLHRNLHFSRWRTLDTIYGLVPSR
jgi:hypothetical protein